ncbi:MAG: hypothetical protein L6Q60_13210 [Rhodocyclaceae bacterium]|jgi:hypothetical protein|nr:hypothetical protein [Rhodocyclaceae bacterium]
MNSVRMTSRPQHVLERPDATRLPRRDELPPVAGVEGVEADRRRSVGEELKAAAERFPVQVPDDLPAQTRALVEAIARLGDRAGSILHPLDRRALRLVVPDHIDEQV